MTSHRWTASILASVLISVPTGALLLSSSSASAADSLTIVSPVVFKDGIVVRDAVKAECGLLTKVPAYIKEFAERDLTVKLVEKAAGAKGRVLRVEIEEVREPGGAGPGPRSLTVGAELREDGKVIGTITARRTTLGGPFGAFGGVCRSLQRCAKTLGKDLAGWIEAPAMDVKLSN